jgi:hypothetical protein
MAASFRRLVGVDLLCPSLPADLYNAAIPLLCHDAADDPRFTYANLAAQRLWQLTWDQFLGLPSRLSAEPAERAARESLLARVASDGFVDDYSGVRISSTGQRFLITDTVVWNVSDDTGRLVGQAARIGRWAPLASQ